MKIVAFTGAAGAGKDTCADGVVRRLGWVRRGFADPLYEEVAKAYSVPIDQLRDRAIKETPQEWLALAECSDNAFFKSQYRMPGDDLAPRSPRWVLQKWGTEYRRAQDPLYWIKQMDDFVFGEWMLRPRGIVIPDCRFPNEADWVRANGGVIFKVIRPGNGAVEQHSSEAGLSNHYLSGTILNNQSIDRVQGDAISSTLQAFFSGVLA